MPVVVATITPLPEFRRDVLVALQESISAVHGERGCELYALHEAGESFVFIEQWESDHALDQHNNGEAVSAVVSKIADKLKDPVEIVRAVPILGGDPHKGRLVSSST